MKLLAFYRPKTSAGRSVLDPHPDSDADLDRKPDYSQFNKLFLGPREKSL